MGIASFFRADLMLAFIHAHSFDTKIIIAGVDWDYARFLHSILTVSVALCR